MDADLDGELSMLLASLIDARSHNRTPDLAKDLASFIQARVSMICGLLGIEGNHVSFVTVRSSFRKDQLYLRPIFSFPTALSNYFENPNDQRPFSFGPDIDPLEGMTKSFPPGWVESRSLDQMSSYCEIENTNDDSKLGFRKRIHDFWFGASEKYLGSVTPVGNRIFCWMSGRRRVDAIKHGNLELENVVAIYFHSTSEVELREDVLEKASREAKKLFDSLQTVYMVASELFLTDSLKIIAELIANSPEDHSSQADEIAEVLNKLDGLFTKHLVGRRSDKDSISLHYFRASYDDVTEHVNLGTNTTEQVVFPRLEIYPQARRDKFEKELTVPYQVAHKFIPSTTKFLLLSYFEARNPEIVWRGVKQNDVRHVVVNPDFKKIFEGSEFPQVNWSNLVCTKESSDLLHMSAYDERLRFGNGEAADAKLWTALNRSNSGAEASKAIVAFVIEGAPVAAGDGKQLPLGVIGVESTHFDAFSDEEVNGLRQVLRGLAGYIRRNSHRNSVLSYKKLLSEQRFGRIPINKGWGEALAKRFANEIIFSSLRGDWEKIESLLNEIGRCVELLKPEEREPYFQSLKLSSGSFAKLRSLAEEMPKIKDSEINRSNIHLIEHRRTNQVFDWMNNNPLPSSTSPDVASTVALAEISEMAQFLDAAPENFTWSSYFVSIAQVLGERVNYEQPTFTLMSGGHSASRMLMAIKDGELRQVLKLSTVERLRNERRNYRDHVRFRVVNAARIAVDAFAFETPGIFPRDANEAKKFPSSGVLVSDLVVGTNIAAKRGEDHVRTLLGILALWVMTNPNAKKPDTPKIKQVSSALQYLFEEGTILWQEKQTSATPTTGIIIQKAFKIEDINKLIAESKADLKKIVIDTNHVTSELEANMEVPPPYLEALSSFTHGDLNPRNLTWANKLNSFFMIDFEFVDHRFFGLDQIKLCATIMTDLLTEVVSLNADTDQLNSGLEKIRSATLLISSKIQSLGYVAEEIHTTANVELKSIKRKDALHLEELVLTILATIKVRDPREFRLPASDFKSTAKMWKYAFVCCLFREFLYSQEAIKEYPEFTTTGSGAAIKKNIALIANLVTAVFKDKEAFPKMAVSLLAEGTLELSKEKFATVFRMHYCAHLLAAICEPQKLQ